MKATNKTTPNNRCYIISSEDLNQNKKLKGLFRMMHLEEVTPYGSVLPVIEGMHYYAIEEMPKGKAPVTKKCLDTIGMTEEDYKEHCEIAALLNGSPCHLRLVDDEPADEEEVDADGDASVLAEVIADLGGTLIKPSPHPTQKEIDADPDAFISFPRALFTPYFGEDCPDEYIELIVHCLLEADRYRQYENEGGDN